MEFIPRSFWNITVLGLLPSRKPSAECITLYMKCTSNQMRGSPACIWKDTLSPCRKRSISLSSCRLHLDTAFTCVESSVTCYFHQHKSTHVTGFKWTSEQWYPQDHKGPSCDVTFCKGFLNHLYPKKQNRTPTNAQVSLHFILKTILTQSSQSKIFHFYSLPSCTSGRWVGHSLHLPTLDSLSVRCASSTSNVAIEMP